MKPILIAGSSLVTLALISYTVSFVKFHRAGRITKNILLFQTIGVILDVTATCLMIAGSSKGPFTLHGMLGYSSLALMLADTAFFWRSRNLEHSPSRLRNYSKLAYIWWVMAYLTGSLLVMLR